MEQVATLTVRQEPDEPRLRIRIYTDKLNFYIHTESNDPTIPPSVLMRIKPTNFIDAKKEGGKFLRLTRGVFRVVSGKAPKLPEHMKEIKKEISAYLNHLLTNSFVGKN